MPLLAGLHLPAILNHRSILEHVGPEVTEPDGGVPLIASFADWVQVWIAARASADVIHIVIVPKEARVHIVQASPDYARLTVSPQSS